MPTDTLQITTFITDYSNALTRANALDAQIKADAESISSTYAGLVALSVRQAFGAIEFTLSKDSAGNYNTSDILVFMKGMYHTLVDLWRACLIVDSCCRDLQ